MNVWCHLPTIFRMRNALRLAGLTAIIVALITTLFFGLFANATPGVNQTLSFQGRLLDNNGSAVPDGYYNVQFKIYENGTGTAANNPGGTLKWTETYTNNNSSTGGVQVTDGYLSVNLGSINPFGNNVDWNQDTLWLSMNVGGSAVACSNFGTAPCVGDGEMLPMKRLTASPYSLNSARLNGKTADNFVQLGQGPQTESGTDTDSISINKTGTGNLVRLQSGSADVLTIAGTGDLLFGNNSNHKISIAPSVIETAGMNMTIAAGNGGDGTGSSGGELILNGGNGGGVDGNGGNVSIDAGIASGAGVRGNISIGATNAGSINIGNSSVASTQDIQIGTNNSSGSTSNITIGSGNLAAGGSTTIQAKDGVVVSTNGSVKATFSGTENAVFFGNGQSSDAPENFKIQGTSSSSSSIAGGSLSIQGGDATIGDADGGNIILSGGNGSGSGAKGTVQIGDGNDSSEATLLTLDKSVSAPSVTNNSALLGSMYYDTTIGKVQCYEADGWGSCSDSPDTFVTLTPEYSNAVTNGDGIGEFKSDFCSDSLNINDGSPSQAEICGTDETFNFYSWTSEELSSQEKNVYVTYKLPGNFKEFIPGSTSLMSMADDENAGVAYQIYKKTDSGLIACGDLISATNQAQPGWTKSQADGLSDPSLCSFSSSDSIVIKISMSSKENSSAYISDLSFTFSNN